MLRAYLPLPFEQRTLRDASRPRWETLSLAGNLAALFLLSAFLRVWQLDHLPGINGDEAWYGVQVMRLVRGEAFSWRTPTGNPLNPFYLLPLCGLHLVWAPSFLLLRLPAMASGLLALPVNFALCRRVFGHPTATVTTLALAVLPINIAYSRFGWDASQTLLFTLPVCYLALLAVKEPQRGPRWLCWSAAALGSAILVHPTNIFLAPMWVAAFLWLRGPQLVAAWRTARRGRSFRAATVGAATGAVCLLFLARHWAFVVGARLLAVDQYAAFAANYLRLFNGVTIFRYIAGSRPPADGLDFDPLDGLAWCLVLLAVIGILRSRHAQNYGPNDAGGQAVLSCLLWGWGLSLLGFFLVAGPQAIAPHYERYGLVLIAPGTILCCLGLSDWLRRVGAMRLVANLSALAVAWLLALVFCQEYFGFIRRTGGESHATFRTGDVEPKLAAFRELLARRDPRQTTWLAVDDYWNCQPLTYLALGQRSLQVATPADCQSSPAFRQAAAEGRAWLVGFEDGDCWNDDAKPFRREDAERASAFVARDYSGRPVLRLEQASRSASLCERSE